MRSSFYKTLLLLSLLNVLGTSLPFASAQTESSASAPAKNAASPTMAQIRQMIDRGHAEEALKDLDGWRAFAGQYGFAPDSASAYLLAARMLLRREYVPVAQEFARKALELNPELPLAHALLGEIALAGEHLDEAIAEFEKERVRNPLDG